MNKQIVIAVAVLIVVAVAMGWLPFGSLLSGSDAPCVASSLTACISEYGVSTKIIAPKDVPCMSGITFNTDQFADDGLNYNLHEKMCHVTNDDVYGYSTCTISFRVEYTNNGGSCDQELLNKRFTINGYVYDNSKEMGLGMLGCTATYPQNFLLDPIGDNSCEGGIYITTVEFNLVEKGTIPIPTPTPTPVPTPTPTPIPTSVPQPVTILDAIIGWFQDIFGWFFSLFGG